MYLAFQIICLVCLDWIMLLFSRCLSLSGRELYSARSAFSIFPAGEKPFSSFTRSFYIHFTLFIALAKWGIGEQLMCEVLDTPTFSPSARWTVEKTPH